MSDTPETEFIPFGPEWEALTMKLPKKFLIKQLRESCLSYLGASQLSTFHLNEALKIADERDQLRAINAELLEALERIERWFGEFPETGKVWEGSGEPMSYGACYGSNGERDFMRLIARNALSKAKEAQS